MRTQRLWILAGLGFLSACTTVSPRAFYQYEIDLLNTNQDRVRVLANLPRLHKQEAVFVVPKIVPGIYGAMNFGQYVADFTALDRKGKALQVEKQDTNSWLIRGAKQLSRVSYTVADTWDVFHHVDGEPSNFYRSAGSAYQADSAYVLNYNTLVGYVEGQQQRPYRITIRKPAGFYGASYLTPQPQNDSTDLVQSPTYRELVDSPVLYARPDTAWIQLGQTTVLVALYATSKQHYAPVLAKGLKNVLAHQQAYLGGTLPVEKYSFLVYHNKGRAGSYMGDGLEHSHSTLCLMESPALDDLGPFLTQLTTHEFFHVVTPLHVHAEEIEHYDYRRPTLSRHLWLYEGLTEYATMHMAIKEGLQTLPAFLAVVQKKIADMRQYDNTLSFTELSQNAMSRQDQYYNFYLKGALFNLCLDVKLRELSGGKMGTQELMQQLQKRYGPHKPFVDDQLFDSITKLTYPQMRDFFRDYLEGGKPLPLAETLAKTGFDYSEATNTIKPLAQPTPAQLALRKSWIGQ
jgi:predicted metalloprotease with PDZ domain